MMMIKSKFAFVLTMLLGSIYVDASTIMEKFNSGGRPPLRQMKKTSLVQMYQSSSHARSLQAQKSRYRRSAQANQRTFGGGASTQRRSKDIKIPPYIIYNKTFDL